ncbi:hypothetical protein [Hasllibacter sp. MH4015]|uniref:hypothetical protein n=1 Tax=Hasllibacter sp. MH4015 TaxID=2854029 RepID=UPI001CD21EC9|nr:hypothetical protein [Hasllibacter sp. MH4015]
MPISLRLAAMVAALFASLNVAAAFPQDGLFHQGLICPVDGFEPGTERTASLSFPTLCLVDMCCDLSNPINIRDMDQTFLYDGACTDTGGAFEARLLVGEAAIDGVIVVFNNVAHTYARCEP